MNKEIKLSCNTSLYKELNIEELFDIIYYSLFKDTYIKNIKFIFKLNDKIEKSNIYNNVENDTDINIFNVSFIIENRSFGRYVTIEHDDLIKFIVISSKEKAGRNSYLVQYILPAYLNYLKYNKNKNKEMQCYLFHENLEIYQLFIIKLLLTIDIKILNLEKLKFNLLKLYKIDKQQLDLDYKRKFLTYKELRSFRYNISKKNNNPTTFEEVNGIINVYGKVFGANERETTLICIAIRKLSPDNTIILYPANETSKKHKGVKISSTSKKILEEYKIKYKKELEKINIDIEKKEINNGIVKRNQHEFNINLLNKFKNKKCLLCDCEIENLIIASHIHRVADIINNKNLTVKEKKEKIVDKNNGIWLCANHDKLFERGYIYFKNNKVLLNNKYLEYKDFIYKITVDNEFIENINKDNIIAEIREDAYKEFFNKSTQEYFKEHIDRIKI